MQRRLSGARRCAPILSFAGKPCSHAELGAKKTASSELFSYNVHKLLC